MKAERERARAWRLRVSALLLCAGLAGCAKPQASPATSTTPAPTTTESGGGMWAPGDEPDTDAREGLDAATNDLAIALDTGASCDLVASLRDRICGLAQRICALSSASPEDATMRAQCEDGAARCLTATENVRDRCGP